MLYSSSISTVFFYSLLVFGGKNRWLVRFVCHNRGATMYVEASLWSNIDIFANLRLFPIPVFFVLFEERLPLVRSETKKRSTIQVSYCFAAAGVTSCVFFFCSSSRHGEETITEFHPPKNVFLASLC